MDSGERAEPAEPADPADPAGPVLGERVVFVTGPVAAAAAGSGRVRA